jgi:hypothetical protein
VFSVKSTGQGNFPEELAGWIPMKRTHTWEMFPEESQSCKFPTKFLHVERGLIKRFHKEIFIMSNLMN